jgi:hypothetical protein
VKAVDLGTNLVAVGRSTHAKVEVEAWHWRCELVRETTVRLLALLMGHLAGGWVRHRDCPYGPTARVLAETGSTRLAVLSQ